MKLAGGVWSDSMMKDEELQYVDQQPLLETRPGSGGYSNTHDCLEMCHSFKKSHCSHSNN